MASFISSFFGGGGNNRGNEAPRAPGGARRHVIPDNQGAPVQYQNFLRAYPSSFMARDDLEKGNKVLLPPSVLAEVSQGAMPHPLLFRINSMRTKKTTYVGVLEFTAPEDICILPLWIFTEMGLMEEELINIFLVHTVPKADYVKIRPHQTAFIELPDPRSFLEIKFRGFVSLTEGDTIAIESEMPSCPQFKFDIVEVKPKSPFKTIITLNCDLKLDFEEPLDYVEPAPQYLEQPALKKKDSKMVMEQEKIKKFKAFSGNYQRLDGKQVKVDPSQDNEEEEYDPRKNKLPTGVRENMFMKSFVGKGVKLN